MNDAPDLKIKSKWNKHAMKYYLAAKGNVPKAMALYIAHEGCQGIVCKECFLNISCNRNPTVGRAIAIRALEEAEKMQATSSSPSSSPEEADSKAPRNTSESNT